MAVNGIGRPHKGHRIRLTTRVTPDVARRTAAAARAADQTVSEYLAALLDAALLESA